MQDPITDLITDLKRLLPQLSPGPWRSFVEGRDHEGGSSFIRTGPDEARGEDIELSGATVADQDFIALARQALPALVDEVERLRDQFSAARTAAE